MRQAITDKSGITLVELLIVISIVSILALALAFSYQGWSGSATMEGEVRQLYTDMLHSKNTAVQTSRDYFMTFDVSGSGSSASSNYTVYEDTDPQPAGDGALVIGSDKVQTGYPKTLDYRLIGYRVSLDYSTHPATVTVSSPLPINTTIATIRFDKGGFMYCKELFPEPSDTTGGYSGDIYRGVIRFISTSTDSAYDCILISQSSLDMGKWGYCNSHDTNDCCIK